MKKSDYNYYVPYNEGVIFMNGITEATFWVDNQNAAAVKQIIENPNDYPQYDKFINKLVKQGFVLNDDVNELKVIDTKYEISSMAFEYRIMILPTYQCNLRCWYCVQSHENSWLTDEHIERIKKLIINRVYDSEITQLNISWFGGEPLLGYDKLLELTLFAQKLAKEKGIEFICGITTNATLLTPKRIEALHDAWVNFYQITIDGPKEDHDKVKQLGQLSAFDTTLANIAYLAKNTQCTLRFNYTKDTLQPEVIIKQLSERLPKEVRNNLNLNIQQVWQSEGNEDVDFADVVRLMEMANEIGIRPSLRPIGLCYVDHKHFDCVYPSGQVGKCENDLKDVKKGIITDSGDVDFSNAENLHFTPYYEVQDTECKKCKYLPICWGPCSQKRLAQLRANGKINCTWQEKDQQMSKAILYTYFNNKFNSKIVR